VDERHSVLSLRRCPARAWPRDPDRFTLGADLQPERDDLDRFNRFGYFLGTAFQIQDDVLNLVGDMRAYGKEIGGDLLEGKRTLVLAHLFANTDSSEKQRLKAFFGKPRAQRLPRELSWLKLLLRDRGSIDYARAAANLFAQGASGEFATAYRDATPGPDLDFLRSLIGHVATRNA
jgi:geranylgeranyl diphosphate synthase type II